jgi:apolipoprotein N-acyltransferase
LHTEWTGLYEIPFRREPRPTFYQRYGFRLVPLALWLAVGILIVTGWRGRREGS